jgi:hypothetical protein
MSRYQTAEERRASHILIPAAASATPEEKAKAKALAEDLLKQVRQNPRKFGELAAKFSKDPGSAEKGGDLGFFARGLMVKPFDEAAFSMKVARSRDRSKRSTVFTSSASMRSKRADDASGVRQSADRGGNPQAESSQGFRRSRR